jgi:competence protein ComEC
MSKIRIILGLSVVMLIILALVTWPDGKVRVIFCNVGQGDGILVAQNNFQMVIDAGGDNKLMLGCLERNMPFWDKEIELAIMTHWDTDHSGGLNSLIDNYKVDKLYGPSKPVDQNVQKFYTGNLAINDVIRYKEIEFDILGPGEDWGNDNDNSVVGILNVTGHRILLTGDASAQVEQKMVWRGILQGRVEVLKVSHHGSAEGTSEELLNAVKPAEAVISVGKNSFGHPTKVVLDRLTAAGVKIRRTDLEGDIIYVL